MKKLFGFLSLLFILLLFSTCKQGNRQEESVVTRRIQYDVPIKTPDPDYDWWTQNIEGPSREKLVKEIMGAVFSGKVKAYDYISYELLTDKNLRDIQGRTDTLSLERSDMPGEFYDTIIRHTLDLREITRLRFLEEWYMDGNSLVFNKSVLGICPLLARYDESGELRGFTPVFWVFYDDRYPALLKESQ